MSLDPTAIDLEQARRRAKELLRAARTGDPAAQARFTRDDREPKLADAQHVVARELGHRSWTALVAAARSAGQDALYHAAESDDPDEFDRLVARGAEVAGSHALFRALDFDDLDRVQRILAAGADPNERYPGEPDVRGDTPLHHAVLRGRNVATIDALVGAGADVGAEDGGGLTPFRMAVRLGNTAVADRLLVLGAADALTPTDRFFSACMRAVHDDGDEARRLRPEAVFEDRDRFVPITAVRWGNRQAVVVLLDLAFDIATRDSLHGGTLLHWAAWHGRLGIVEALLDRGADPSATAEHGSPAAWARHGAGDPAIPSEAHAKCVEVLEAAVDQLR